MNKEFTKPNEPVISILNQSTKDCYKLLWSVYNITCVCVILWGCFGWFVLLGVNKKDWDFSLFDIL